METIRVRDDNLKVFTDTNVAGTGGNMKLDQLLFWWLKSFKLENDGVLERRSIGGSTVEAVQEDPIIEHVGSADLIYHWRTQ